MAKEIINEEFEFPEGMDIGDNSSDVEIEVVDDTPEEDRGKKPIEANADSAQGSEEHEAELDKYNDNVQKRFNQLTHRYHDERRAKEAMQREHEQAIQLAQSILAENQRLQETLTWGQKEYLNEVNAKIEYAQKFAEDRYRRAYETGDTEGVLAAQKELQEIAIQKDRAANFVPPVNIQPQSAPIQQTANTVYNQPQVAQQPPEAAPRDVKAEEWASKNPWFGADAEMTSLAYGLHSKLVNSGVDPQSDEYYATIDKRMREVFPEHFGIKQKPRSSSPVAPASRSTASRKVTLTTTQVGLAKKLGVPLDVYAKHVAKLEQSNG